MGPGSLNNKKPVLVFRVKKGEVFFEGADRHATKTLVLLRWSNRQRSQLGKSKTEGGTTSPLARRGFICLPLGDFYTVKLAPYYYNVQCNNKYRTPQYQGYSPHAQMPLYNIQYVAVW